MKGKRKFRNGIFLLLFLLLASAWSQKADAAVPADAEKWCGHYYKIFTEEVSVLEAKARCEAMGGYLVTVTSSAERDFVNNLRDSKNCRYIGLWVGAVKRSNRRTFEWMNGEECRAAFYSWSDSASSWYTCWYDTYSEEVDGNLRSYHADDKKSFPIYHSLIRTTGRYACDAYKSSCGENAPKVKHGYICEWGDRMDIGDAANIQIELKETVLTYNSGKAAQPSVTVTWRESGMELINNQDYELIYSNNMDIGEGKVKVRGVGRFKGEIVKTFDIVPSRVSGSMSGKADTDRNINFFWQPVKEKVSGYEVEYADNENFVGSKSERMAALPREMSYQVKDTKRATTYYFRVRAYKTVLWKEYKGEWSRSVSQFSGSQLVVKDFWGFGNSTPRIDKKYFDKFFGSEQAKRFAKDNSYNGANGICAGMSVAALASISSSIPAVESFGAESLSKVSAKSVSTNGGLGWNALDYCKYAHAFKNTYIACEERSRNGGDLRGLYQAVRSAQNNGRGVIIGMNQVSADGNHKMNGHTVVALGIRSETAAEVQVRIYDPNHPKDENRTMYLYRTSSTSFSDWSYANASYSWRGSNGIGYDSMLSGDKNDQLTFCVNLPGNFARYLNASGSLPALIDYVLMVVEDIPQNWTTAQIESWLDGNGNANNRLDITEIDRSGGDNGSGSYMCWIKKGSGLNLKDVPAGMSITLAAPYHSAQVKVKEKSDVIVEVEDTKVMGVQVTSGKAASFTVQFSDSSEGSAVVEQRVISGKTAEGKQARIVQSDSDVKVTGVTSMQVISKKGTEDSSGNLVNPTTRTAKAAGLDAAKTYQAVSSGSKLQLKGSSKNNGVYDEVVSTDGLKVNKVYASGSLKYKVTKLTGKTGTASVTAPKAKTLTSVIIPDTVTIQGVKLKVNAIEKDAFKGMSKLKKVTLGKNVTKIGANAFYGDKQLTGLTINSTGLKTVGKNAVRGISAKAAIVVPKSKLSAYKKLFSSATGYTSGIRVQDTNGLKIWTVVFKNGKKTVKTQQVVNGKNASAPKLKKKGYILSWSTSYKKINRNLTVNAVWTPEVPKKGYRATVNGMIYKVTKSDKKKGTVQLVGVTSKKQMKYTVPATVKLGKTTFTVNSIAAKAFYKCSKARNFVLPKTITSIGKNAFGGTLKNTVVMVPKAQYQKLKKQLAASGLDKKAVIKKK